MGAAHLPALTSCRCFLQCYSSFRHKVHRGWKISSPKGFCESPHLLPQHTHAPVLSQGTVDIQKQGKGKGEGEGTQRASIPTHGLWGATQHLYKCKDKGLHCSAVNSGNGHARLKLLLWISSIHSISLSNGCLHKCSNRLSFRSTYCCLKNKKPQIVSKVSRGKHTARRKDFVYFLSPSLL